MGAHAYGTVGRVLFGSVADDIVRHDAPALATATIGVAMGVPGAAVSAETADVVLTTDHVSRLPTPSPQPNAHS